MVHIDTCYNVLGFSMLFCKHGLEPPSVEGDVWRYIIVELHARNNNSDIES